MNKILEIRRHTELNWALAGAENIDISTIDILTVARALEKVAREAPLSKMVDVLIVELQRYGDAFGLANNWRFIIKMTQNT